MKRIPFHSVLFHVCSLENLLDTWFRCTPDDAPVIYASSHPLTCLTLSSCCCIDVPCRYRSVYRYFCKTIRSYALRGFGVSNTSEVPPCNIIFKIDSKRNLFFGSISPLPSSTKKFLYTFSVPLDFKR